MPLSVLIIGEHPDGVDFSGPAMPPGINAEVITRGLEDSRDRLRDGGHDAEILWLHADREVEDEVEAALAGRGYDVFVVGAGLRTLPPMAAKFERLMNELHSRAPGARFAFNSRPDDSDNAALRLIDR